MAIRGAIGRGAGWIGGRAVSSTGFGVGLAGLAAAGGTASAVLDREGPYPQIQQSLLGDPEAFRYTIKANLATALSGQDDISGPIDYYYGQTVNPDIAPHVGLGPRPGVGRTTPVSGDIVFGAGNLRRTGVL